MGPSEAPSLTASHIARDGDVTARTTRTPSIAYGHGDCVGYRAIAYITKILSQFVNVDARYTEPMMYAPFSSLT